MLNEFFSGDMWLDMHPLGMGIRHQLYKVLIAGHILCEQNQMVKSRAFFASHPKLATGNGFYIRMPFSCFEEFWYSGDCAMICYCKARHSKALSPGE